MRNCVGAGARVSSLGSHTGTPRYMFSNASSSALKRVMFSILFSYENLNQSAVNDRASVAHLAVLGGHSDIIAAEQRAEGWSQLRTSAIGQFGRCANVRNVRDCLGLTDSFPDAFSVNSLFRFALKTGVMAGRIRE